jgi:hypothetical protein
MNFARLSLFVILAVTAALAGTGTFVRAAAPKPALFSMLTGTWNCTYHGPKGTRTSSATFTAVNSNWLQYSGKVSAYGGTPAHESINLLGYDSKKGEYVGMGGSSLPGDWGIGTAKASPTAMTMTFSSAYPADPTNQKTTYTFGSPTTTFTSSWTEKGKAMSAKGTCTKQ